MFAARQGFFSSTLANISGGTVTTVGANTVRTFTSNDTLTVVGRNIPMTYLVVGAGGGSNLFISGGAGGQVTTGTFVAAGSYPIVIGQGNSGNGQSSLSTIAVANIGGNGRSSGGGNTSFNSTIYTGGNSTPAPTQTGGGGAGAGQNGFSGNGIVGGVGGNGYQSNITGTLTYYAGGGGAAGVTGGLGGGGNGQATLSPPYAEDGVTNTGGGGGAGSTALINTPSYGGSGIVIVTYVTPT